MLVLTRKSGDSFRIGNDVIVRILDTKSGHIKIGIEAPKEIGIYREEIYLKIVEENKAAHTNLKESDLLEELKKLV
ncbi:MAG: carbon storage regulator CsrA [Candidatus Marinimicrobia bacterium]|nr:carbon storage regulator CsrA [Candidatus Neomarinimicrobiota bacterium]